MALEVLVVDDEADIRELVSGVLEDEGYAVRTAADSTTALEAIEERRPSLLLLDVWLQGSRLDGLQILQEVKRRDPNLPVLMISGHGNLDTAVAAVRRWDATRCCRTAADLGTSRPTNPSTTRQRVHPPAECGLVRPARQVDSRYRLR